MSDFKAMLRSLSRSPFYVLGVTLFLALGLGVNLALGTLVQRQILRPHDAPEPQRMVTITVRRGMTGDGGSLSAENVLALKRQATTVTQIAALAYRNVVLDKGEQVSRVGVSRVSAGTFPLMGMPAYFADEDDLAGQAPKVVLSHAAWMRRFGGDPSLVGRSVRLDGVDHLVVGILPPGFRSPDNTLGDFNVPLALTPQEIQQRGWSFLNVTARLAAGRTLPQAQDEVKTIHRRIETERGEARHSSMGLVRPQLDAQNPERHAQLMLLSTCGLFVLLLTCANVANLALTRWLPRSRELALRTALGGQAWEALRPLVLESLLLASVAGMFALLCHGALLNLLSHLLPLGKEEAAANPWLLVALVLLAALLLIAPLVWALRHLDPGKTLQDMARGTGSRSHGRLRAGLVVTQVAIATTLLATSFLLVQSLRGLSHVPLGFDPERVLISNIHLPQGGRFEAPEARWAYQEALLERVRNLPGVASAALVNEVPLNHSVWASSYTLEGEPEGGTAPNRQALVHVVAGDYFGTMGIPLTGRPSGAAEMLTCVVNESFARHAWPHQPPVDRTVKLQRHTYRVVGVAGDIRYTGLRNDMEPQIYVPFRSDPQPSFELVVKASEQAEALARSLATVLKGLDRGVPSDAPHPMNDLLAEEVARDRAMGLLFTGFSALALVLAALGLGGALSLAVTQRRPELGLRMALGATGAQILNLVLGQGFRQVALGLMLGLPAAWGLGHILRNQLYGVSPGDPRPMALAALVLGLTAALACLIPALRAARVQPAEALRSE